MIKKMNINIKKISNIFEKNYKFNMYIAFSILFLYIYNISLKEYIYFNDMIVLISMMFALTIMFLSNYNNILKSYKYINKSFFLIPLILIALIIFRNADLNNKHFGMTFFLIISILFILVLLSSNKWINICLNIILFFTFIHVSATWFCYLFPNYYITNIITLFPDFKEQLIYQFEHNQIAGITQHYSTNAIYLIIGIFVETFYFKFDFKKHKIKSLVNIFMLIITISALLLTGKRAQLVFGLLAILVTILIKNKNDLKKTIKLILITMISAVVLVFALSYWIPSLSNSFMRIVQAFQNNDLFTSRAPMYDLAFNKFKENIFFGNGWASYKYFYSELIFFKERNYMDVHNIYLQLLSEVGIVGFIFFVYVWSKIIYKQIKFILKNKNNNLVCLSFSFQIYLLLDGITGNAIYDLPMLIPYMIFLAIFYSSINILNFESQICPINYNNTNKKILSVSVAAYNLEKMIGQNIESFINSSVNEDIELIITDDESKDKTVEIIEKYQKLYPDTIKLIKQKNAGPGSTVNSGIKNATGKYFKMVDGDDWVITENLNKLIQILKKSDEDMILNNYQVYDDAQKKIVFTKKINLPDNTTFKFEDIAYNIKPDMHNVIFKTEILQNNNIILDNGFYTDVEYLLLPIPYVNTVKYLDLDIYVYRIAQLNQSVSIPSMQRNIKMHDLVLSRLVNFYEVNKKDLTKEKSCYISRRISVMADTQLGTLLTIIPDLESKNKIKEFNKGLRKSSMNIYLKYLKSKKAIIIIFSNYLLHNKLSKKYIDKLEKN